MSKTNFIYESTCTQDTLPDLIEFTVNINKKANSAPDACTLLENDLNIVKDLVTAAKSYIQDSFKQDNFEVKHVTRTFYVATDNPNIKISEYDYSRLPIEQKHGYTTKTESYYNAKVTLYFEYSIDRNAHERADITDFINLLTKAVDLDINCIYNLTNSKTYLDCVYEQLYAKCIDKGMSHIKNITKISQNLIEDSVDLVDITEKSLLNRNNNTQEFGIRKCAAAEESISEHIVSPTIVENLFNFNIEHSLTLCLKTQIEVKQCR